MDHTGTARISGGKLRIGSKRLTIDQGPTGIDSVVLSGQWWPGPGPYTSNMKVVLEGTTYYKVNEL